MPYMQLFCLEKKRIMLGQNLKWNSERQRVLALVFASNSASRTRIKIFIGPNAKNSDCKRKSLDLTF